MTVPSQQEPGYEDGRMGLPLLYHDAEVASSYHTASYAAVAAALPGDLLRPLRWRGGRTLVSVHAFRYRTVTWTAPDGGTRTLAPYGEVGVTAGVVGGPALRGRPRAGRAVGGFVLYLPVTSREARDVGWELWGLPKSVADMDFLDAPDRHRVRLSEGGTEVLTHTVRVRGPALLGSRSRTLWSTRGGQLVETVVPVFAWWQARPGPGAGELVLGAHAVADELRGLELSPRPLAAFRALEYRCALPAGRPVAPVGTRPGHLGADRAFGRFTVAHPGTAPLDQYAGGTTDPESGPARSAAQR
ncbi:Acetoacetate decarboxylase (ADC) [Geodermatophilus sp. DSM 45219]|nr:Acetoacetate decarboxylase (ADC) [Geodermatophilus sp. DSM 45219]